jgi:uncharacterized protein
MLFCLFWRPHPSGVRIVVMSELKIWRVGAQLKRRTFAGAVFSGLGLTGAYAKPPKPKAGDVPMREFGKTGVNVSVIGQGGVRLALLRNKEAAAVQVRHAYELGLNFFDNAHAYWGGKSEEVCGDVLAPMRKELFLTSKSLGRTRKDAEADLELSLKRLKTDYVDLWQLHHVSSMEQVETIFGPGGAMEAIESAKKSGKCRFVGFTGHHNPEVHLEMLKRYDKWDSILMPLHAAETHYKSFEKQVLPVAVKRGMAIKGMKNFANALLLRQLSAKECLDYVLSLPIHCTTVGCSTTGQLDDDLRIAQQWKQLTPEEMDATRKLAMSTSEGALKGPALEFWKTPDGA